MNAKHPCWGDPEGFQTCEECGEPFHLDSFLFTSGSMITLRRIMQETAHSICTTCAMLHFISGAMTQKEGD